MKHESKLSPKQEAVTEQQTHAEAHTQAQAETMREFATSDELLRADAAQTPVPAAVEERLKKSVERLHPPETRPWWKSWLKR